VRFQKTRRNVSYHGFLRSIKHRHGAGADQRACAERYAALLPNRCSGFQLSPHATLYIHGQYTLTDETVVQECETLAKKAVGRILQRPPIRPFDNFHLAVILVVLRSDREAI
jgi:hypothetical protein